jgi:hypothetical protein
MQLREPNSDPISTVIVDEAACSVISKLENELHAIGAHPKHKGEGLQPRISAKIERGLSQTDSI